MPEPREWLKDPDQPNVLFLSGYPIRIVKTAKADMPFALEQDGRSHRPPYWTLAAAKEDAERRADELDDFAE